MMGRSSARGNDSAERDGRGRTAPRWIAAAVLAAGLAVTGCSAVAGAETGSGETSSTSAVVAADSLSGSSTSETIAAAAEAAQAFLATLSDEQREAVLYDYDDETKSTSWSNFPVTFVERAGINLADLDDEQREAAMRVLEALLNDEAYATVTGIMGGDEYLHEESSSTEESLGQYYLALFGDPSDASSWALQFGGHHLGLNADLNGADDEITFAPTHLGIQPAVYTDDEGDEVQPFGTIYETAFAFFDSLSEAQRSELYQGETVASMVCAPGSTCDYPTGTGLSAADLTDEQRELLLDVIANWVGLADEETTEAALAEIEATLDETTVNWSGATEYDMSQGDGIYFQISGPDVYIEFAAQQGSAGADVDGVNTSGWGHVHTIYRDPGNDYAGSVEQQAGSGMGGGPGGAGDGSAPPSGGPGDDS
ncbi:DUF3500 domain-containing protein [Leucobacter weissii]|uniref:DUF3500 domain-containing protein n=1 Tax=Leucobacter weissii TaxID=1983706 RepID=A0A939SBX0_9MICO|nr:DUF3500 domain-containing protein [Leucobacter weissii]MBO1901783.1 DUF3500 domain-containing protein [Leucobacter weissii]